MRYYAVFGGWMGNLVNYAHYYYQGAASSLEGHSLARHLLNPPSSYVAPASSQSDHFILIVLILGFRILGKSSSRLAMLVWAMINILIIVQVI